MRPHRLLFRVPMYGTCGEVPGKCRDAIAVPILELQYGSGVLIEGAGFLFAPTLPQDAPFEWTARPR